MKLDLVLRFRRSEVLRLRNPKGLALGGCSGFNGGQELSVAGAREADVVVIEASVKN